MAGDESERSVIEQRIEDVDEIRSGHELYNDEVDLTVTFENLSEPQAVALMAMFQDWGYHGKVGSSRFVKFWVDGDGSFHPQIEFDIDGECIQPDDAEFEALRETAEVNPETFDYDPVVGWFIDRALEVDD